MCHLWNGEGTGLWQSLCREGKGVAPLCSRERQAWLPSLFLDHAFQSDLCARLPASLSSWRRIWFASQERTNGASNTLCFSVDSKTQILRSALWIARERLPLFWSGVIYLRAGESVLPARHLQLVRVSSQSCVISTSKFSSPTRKIYPFNPFSSSALSLQASSLCGEWIAVRAGSGSGSDWRDQAETEEKELRRGAPRSLGNRFREQKEAGSEVQKKRQNLLGRWC